MDPASRSDAVAFCEHMRPRLVGALSLYCGNADVAEEYAHEALIRVWQDWPRVSAMDAPESWTVRVALNGVHGFFRRRGIEQRAMARAARRRQLPEDVDLAESLALRQAVAALPRRQRTALVLRYYLDMSVEDTATHMQCAPGTVKSLTNKAVQALRSTPGWTRAEVQS